MGKILVIPNSDLSGNHIIKVDITKEVEKSVYSQILSSSTESIIKNNNQ